MKPNSSLTQKLVLELIFLTLVTIYLALYPAAKYEESVKENTIDISQSEYLKPNPLIAERMFVDFNKPAEEEEIVEIESVESETDIIEEPEILTETITYFDVPLSEDLQDHIFKLCEENNIDPALVIAMIQKESNFISSAIGDSGNSLGLMQIQPRWNQARMDRLNCPNLLDPYQNVTVGIDVLVEIFAKGKPLEWSLMSYNGGESYAKNKWAKGEISDYVNRVLTAKAELKTYQIERTITEG